MARKLIKTVKGKSICDYIRNQPNASMFLNATDEQVVLQVVNSIKWKSSKEFEGIDMVIVKKVISQVVNPLTVIFNI